MGLWGFGAVDYDGGVGVDRGMGYVAVGVVQRWVGFSWV